MKRLFYLFVVIIVVYLIYKVIKKRELYYSRVTGYFSSDKTTPYVDVSNRGFLHHLWNNYDAIKSEVIKNIEKFSPIQNDMFFDTITKGNNWKKIYLKWYAPAPTYAYQLFPKTMAILDKYSEIRLAMFSRLDPGTVIEPHRGHFRGCVRVHFSILTPNSPNCFIEVDGKRYYWKDREIIAFDDTYLHRVENNTNRTRIVLFMDIERKFWSSVFKKINEYVMNNIAARTTRANQELI